MYVIINYQEQRRSNITVRPKSSIIYEARQNQRVQPSALKVHINANMDDSEIEKFVLKPAPLKHRQLSTKKTKENESTVLHTNHTQNDLIKNSPVVQELSKKIPLNMQKDKDDLYAETVYLKDQINKITQENYDLKAKLKFIHRENSRMQSVISNVGGYLQQKYENKSDTTLMNKLGISENLLTITLKKQVKDARKELKNKNKEIEDLKHVIKYSNVQELELQIKEQFTELLRLRTLLNQAQRNETITQMTFDFNQYEEKFYVQMQVINSLKQENELLVGQLKFMEEEKFKLENHLDGSKKEIHKQVQVIDDLQQTLKDRITKFDELQQELELFKDTNQSLVLKANKLDNNQLKIISLVKTEQELKKDLQQKQRDIEYLDKTNTELKQKLNDKSSFEAKEKMQLQNELQKVKSQYEELVDKYKELILINQQQRGKETATLPKTTINLKNLKPVNNISDSGNQDKKATKKFKTIQYEDVMHIGLELNYRFRIKKIDLIDVFEKYLFDNRNKKVGEVKLKEIMDRVQKEPFLLGDDDQALLLARYLTEDNNQEYVIYNDELGQSISIVKSILTKLIGPFKILSQDEENNKIKDITNIISKYRSSLKQHFDQIPSKYEGLLTRAQIVNTFEFMDIDMPPELWDFLFLKLFYFSNRTNLFPYVRIFDIFQESIQQEQKEEKKKRKARNYQSRRSVEYN